MRHFLFSLLFLALIAPASAIAQTNVKKAFDKLIESKHAEISETHQRENDPQTGEMESMADIYNFTIPADKKDLIKDIEKAFKQDSEKAYGYYSGIKARKGEVSVASGPNSNVEIVNHHGADYTYALFIDMKKPDHNYRYAYGLSYYRDGRNICGRLVVTYATTLKYRQNTNSNSYNNSVTIRTNHSQKRKDKWFDRFMDTVSKLELLDETGSNPGVLIPILKDLYNLSENCDTTVTAKEREMAVSILSDKLNHKSYKSTTAQKLLKASIDNIKK